MILLIATLCALASGPLLYRAAKPRPRLRKAIDGFVLVCVTVLVLVEVVPESWKAGGPWAMAFLVAGTFGPTLIEHGLTSARRQTHLATLALAVLGLLAHSFGDGTALSPAGGNHTQALALAVAIHSIPVGLLVWWLMAPVFGPVLPALTLFSMCAVTVAGYLTGPDLSQHLDTQGWAWFQALVAGSILHVAFGRPHARHGHHHDHGHGHSH